MSTLYNTPQGTVTRPLLLVVALLLLVGITAVSVAAFDSSSVAPLQTASDELGAGAGGSGDGSAPASDSAALSDGDAAVAGEGAGCNGTNEPTSEACEIEGTVWDGGTV